jgi:hypothetical protein
VAIDPPYRLDPLQNVVNVKWSDVGSAMSWQFFTEWEGSGEFDCPLGPGSTGQSTISMTVTGPIAASPPEGFTISGAPSGGGSVGGGAGSYGGLAFIPSEKSGTGPGSATFQVNGLTCSVSSPSNVIAGSISVSIPAMTMTETETGNVYEMVNWTASAAAGINVGANFVLMD